MIKTTAIVGMGVMLAGLEAFGQAALPTSHTGPWTALPAGWTKQGTGTYATDYDGGGEGSAKFDSSGDWIKINIGGAPATVSYWIKGNTLSGEYTFKVQESPNGSTYTDVAVFNSGNPIPNNSAVQHTNNLSASTRYVQFLYVTKATGNVGIDGVRIEGPGAPSVTFDPSGSQSVPVSNLLELAVSITPSGSGMKSWELTPAYSGSADLSGGLFTFTPATSDRNKSFTLAVVGTNSIGGTTGTVSILVTPYQPPVPVVSFSPEGPYGVMATHTQKLGIAVSPAGSGISGWTLLPSNYAGSAVLAGTNFTFTTAEADGPETYTFTVLATNEFGTTTSAVEIAVSEYVAPPVPGSYICTFEDGSKPGYAVGNVTLSNVVWELDGILIGTSADDLKIDGKSARLKYDPENAGLTMTSQSKILTNGVGTIALWYGPYGSHGEDAPALAIEVSDSLSSGWVPVGEVDAGAVTDMTYESFYVGIREPAYIRIRAISGTVGKSANFDNITVTPYVSQATNPYEAFLLQYNVTPGDPGTAPDEDWDGDGYSNTNEFDNLTNPYDADHHP
jgi:hypothetical protein